MAGVLQHLRSSTLNKRPNPASMVDGQVAINYASGSPGMFFKDSNGSLVKVGPVHVGSGAPNAVPASGGTAGNSLGEQWLDTSGGTYVFKIWDGAAWRSEAGEFVNTTGDTMTGALGIIAGSASTPGLFFSGDANSGLYSPGADQVAISTNGTGRLFIDSSGRLLVGTSSTSSTAGLIVQGAGGAAPGIIRACYTTATPADGDTFGYLVFGDSAHADAAWVAAARDGGTWSGSSKPTRLVFFTAADGADEDWSEWFRSYWKHGYGNWLPCEYRFCQRVACCWLGSWNWSRGRMGYNSSCYIYGNLF